MCRFLVYKGTEPIQLSHLVTRPKHSIINQAFESKLRMPSSRPMNADGFGIGWYDPLPTTPTLTLPRATSIPAPPEPTTPLEGQHPSHSHSSHSQEYIPTPVPPNDPSQDIQVDPLAGLDQTSVEILEARERERELENERPCLFKSIHPAWSNANLTRLAEKIRSALVFAHVRASTMAGAPSEDNCHPWMFDKLMWMHNGEINEFKKIKRAVQQSLPEELFLYPSGYTDSEWAFMIFLSKLKDPHARSFSHVELRDAMMETIRFINKLSKEAGITGPSLMNFVVTDGETVVATRYISSRTSEASSLFFSSGTSFDEYQEGGLYRMTKADKRENIIMVASEPLTFERSDWMEVKTNTMIVITPKMNLLQIPIIDEYWVTPQDPAALTRSRDFAIKMGFGLGFASEQARKEDVSASA
ncbi:glutamine amidotransferase [Kwoniella mangroviensis CBS 10435]|uniref:Glutamine amidotransferase n=1 Tax=Kwoniella mangroviensis CBS 10435 TaxID=1331196 RepID=A0A1B9IF37_9TREE|nr:glutamine amidotransferase [Kwoniella mangroviensis CBS 8507]OCF54165.1 glutamine amidotransferase [Kwoniella mangroviensis CBS 10435]OCF66028.1 glutamine amidotransferase [Kwoniella mangroviensis CBS 8507]OCF71898.1 glutamine amidotransferase [Kwoniella mangroviensis CBS 8886]